MSSRARIVRGLIGVAELARKDPTPETLAERRDGFESLGKWMKPERTTVTERFELGGVAVDSVVNCPAVKRTIVYVHGGGFIYGGNAGHMHMLSLLSRYAEAEILAVDYRVAPEAAFPAALDDVSSVLDTLGDETYSLAGDSAGGNLALASTIARRDSGLTVPRSLTLLSAPLDATFENKYIRGNATTDPIISPEKLEFFLSQYAGILDRRDPRISPYFAELGGLPPMSLHASKNEVLYGDSLYASRKLRDSGGVCETRFPANLWHAWHLFSRYVPEARDSIKIMAEFITKYDPSYIVKLV